ncbi:hypothetical protein GOP47_0007041 [Adiantum capillus-veneris]|uniref:Uncharacterized protein n=1 Tax=Adiantum capillus-veneris TaxID=13818 RepID=A0A9D4V1D4_ADICA|nr:hypothetical protein GOP47_0030716 [Adiantum capillus-veneris]KAI5077217.1 hypothetical protein GOP47_0007041 [Adiantum capillus-veneris]
MQQITPDELHRLPDVLPYEPAPPLIDPLPVRGPALTGEGGKTSPTDELHRRPDVLPYKPAPPPIDPPVVIDLDWWRR